MAGTGVLAETMELPPELVGRVVSKPAAELPVVNAKVIRNTTELYLANRGIEALWGFERFMNLEVLWINNNKISVINNLDANFRLQRIFAHSNRIRSLKGSLLAFKFLRELNVSKNKLTDLSAVLSILGQFQYLEHLELHGNPVAEEGDYRLRVIHAIPSLHVFDRHVITEVERSDAEKKFGHLAKIRGTPKKDGPAKITDKVAPGDSIVQKMLAAEVRRVKHEEKSKEHAEQAAMFSSPGRSKPAGPVKSALMAATRAVEGLADTKEDSSEATVLGEWELVVIRRVFEAADDDGGGTLDRSELPAVLEEAGDVGFALTNAEDLDSIFKAMDDNEDGKVTWKEFVLALQGAPGVEPKLRFRPLSREECELRAKRYYKKAADIQTKMLPMPSDDPRRPALTSQSFKFSKKATRLQDLAQLKRGVYEPPDAPPPPAKPRSDKMGFISTVPLRQAYKTLGAAGRDFKVPAVGEESDSDTDDDEDKLTGDLVETFRRRRKAGKKHVVLTSTYTL